MRLGIIVFATTLLLFPTGARGQQPAPPAPAAVGGVSIGESAQPRFLLDRAAASQFDSAFDNIAERAHVLIVTEGTPLRTTLTAEQLQVQFGDPSAGSEQPLQDLIAKLAAAYDYDSEQVDARTFLLRKRYSDLADLPCVTYAEVISGLKAVLQVVDAYSPAPTPGDEDSNQHLFDTLSPDQKVQAVKGVSLSDLDPGQRQLACESLEQGVLEPRIAALRSAIALLSTLRLSGTTFRWVTALLGDGTRAKAFGYQGRFGTLGRVGVCPLTAPFKSLGASGYERFTILPKDAKGNSIPRPIRFTDDGGRKVQVVDIAETFAEDPTVPSDQDKAIAPDGMLWHRAAHTLILTEAANRLEPSAASDAPTHSEQAVQPKATVENAVADKVVNVFGQHYQGDARHYVKSLCDVYGLQLLAGEHSTYTIATPRPRPTETPADVPAEIRRVTPLSLIRAMTGQAEQRKKAIRDQMSRDPAFSPERLAFEDRNIAYKAAFEADNGYYFPAVRRLIALAEPTVPTPASPPIPVSAVGPEALRLIALTSASNNCMAQLRYLQHYVPPECLARPETLVLQMSEKQNDGMATLTFVYNTRRANGTLNFQANSVSVHRLQNDPPPAAAPPTPAPPQP